MARRSPETLTVDCPSCGAHDAIQIELTLPDASEVTFNSCHRCEHRWWQSDSEVLDLNTVLDKARKH
jgi:DNA-directed RNA polymerase subunit M/transcription elongation factor TFIIS